MSRRPCSVQGEQLRGIRTGSLIWWSVVHELGSLASTLRTNDLQGLLGNLQDLARRQPAVFVGASLAAGFAMVRVGKVAVSGMSRADLPKMPEVNREPN